MQIRFIEAFASLSSALQSALEPIVVQDDFPALLSAAQVSKICSASGLSEMALAVAVLPLAAACSLTPISNFHVGAIARGVSGNFYFGANMEFRGASMQQTVHAEQSTVIHAWLRGEKRLTSVTVNYTPCGHCRQFMNELNSGTALAIHLPERSPSSLGEYLPYSFGPRDLHIVTPLMDPIDHGYTVETQDILSQFALAACNQSYAPYSQSYSGIALEADSGRIYTGRYAENAAFNPSLSPLQAALVLLNLSSEDCRKIRQVVLVERRDPLVSQLDATCSILSTLGCQQLKHITI